MLVSKQVDLKFAEFGHNKTVTSMIKLIVFVSLFNLSKESMFLPKKIFLDSVYKDAPKSWFEYVRKFIHKILGGKFNYSRCARNRNWIQSRAATGTLMSIFV